ncbi:unnamed protein product [Rhizophagus irregularis]|nr:unnamed protein product [Rhizophagus irregularis]
MSNPRYVYDLVPSFHLVYHVGLDLVGIADVKNARDIDDVLSFTDHTLANISRKSPPSYLEATTGSGFRCHYMKRYDNINNSDVQTFELCS